MKRKLSVGIAALICLGVFIVFGILAAVTVSSFGGFRQIGWRESEWFSLKPQKGYTIDQTLSFSQDEIERFNEIAIGSVSADITVTSEGEELVAHLYGDYRSAREIKLIADEDNGRLEIKVHRPNFNITNSRVKLDITIPESYVKNLALASVSGDVNMIIQDKELDKLNMASTSGNIQGKLKSCELNASSISGSVQCVIERGNMHAATTSGDISCRTGSGDIDATSVSGEIDIHSGDFKQINANSTSGDVNITVPSDSSFKINFDSVSGSVDCNVPLNVQNSSKRHFEGTYGNGDGYINAHTVSGSCNIDVQ